VRSGPGEVRTILLLHIISVRPSKQPLVVRVFLKVYVEIDSSFLFLQEQIKDIIIIETTSRRGSVQGRCDYTTALALDIEVDLYCQCFCSHAVLLRWQSSGNEVRRTYYKAVREGAGLPGHFQRGGARNVASLKAMRLDFA
jgi:hypothetical protein